MKGQISYNLQSDSMIIYKRLPKQPLKIVHSRPNIMYVKTYLAGGVILLIFLVSFLLAEIIVFSNSNTPHRLKTIWQENGF